MTSTIKAGEGADAGALALLAVGVVSVAAAAVFVRLAAAHPLTASFVRLAVGAVVLLVIARARRFPHGADLRRSVLAGVLLAAHFALWIGSLSSTTVAGRTTVWCERCQPSA